MHTGGVSRIRRVMCGTVVQAEAGGEADARLEPVLFHQCPRAILDVFSNLRHGQPRSYVFPRVFPHQPVHLCGAPDTLVRRLRVLVRHAFVVAHLFGSRSPGVARNMRAVTYGIGTDHAGTHSSLYGWISPSGKIPSG